MHSEQIEKILDFPIGSIDFLEHSTIGFAPRGSLCSDRFKKDQIFFLNQIYKRGPRLANSKKFDIPSSLKWHDFSPSLDNYGFVVIDKNVYNLWREDIKLKDTPVFLVDACESKKSLEQLAKIKQAWIEAGQPKNWAIVGGGITTDMVGFLAYLCDEPADYFPTTLLAMVDAAFGGKTAVNFCGFKNQLGAFSFPSVIHFWLPFLETLPNYIYAQGLSEVAKHCILGLDYETGKETLLAFQKRDFDRQKLELIGNIKCKIVKEDPFETNKRQLLNLGHTFAHGFETLSKNRPTPISHGLAVALGIKCGYFLLNALGKKPPKPILEISDFLIDSLKYEYSKNLSFLKKMKADKLISAMLQDKKRSDSRIPFVLPRSTNLQSSPMDAVLFLFEPKELLPLLSIVLPEVFSYE